jgi:hypothetical protein
MFSSERKVDLLQYPIVTNVDKICLVHSPVPLCSVVDFLLDTQIHRHSRRREVLAANRHSFVCCRKTSGANVRRLSERDVNEEDLPIMHLLRADGVATDDVRELFDKLGVQAFTFRLFDRPATLLLEGPKNKEKFLDDLKNEGKEDWFSFVEYRQAIYSVD